MTDESVASALRSSARLVVIEAPAGCGKTFQGAEYAREVAESNGVGRVLILTHTHAACDVFASRTKGVGQRVDIRTIDSLIGQIAGAYHQALGLPLDTGAWARSRKDGYAELAAKVARLLRESPMIARSLASRYPIVICDEHQDASPDQHTVAMGCHEGGAKIRVFGDPMQRIFGNKKGVIDADGLIWQSVKGRADIFDELDEPHRWPGDTCRLGRWILAARMALSSGGQVDLCGELPPGVSVIVAENQSPKRYGGYQVSKDSRTEIDLLVKNTSSLLVLASQNATVGALRSFFNRKLPIWEGHVRESLADLVNDVINNRGAAPRIAQAAVTFLNKVSTGFSHSAYAKAFLDEVNTGCIAKRRGKPAALQALGRIILDQPDHRGVAAMLSKLNEMRKADADFHAVKIDHQREFWDAIQLGDFEDPDEGVSTLSLKRTHAHPTPPPKAISTIHKAKGLEADNVVIIPCDAQHLKDSLATRSLLYVAVSRAKRTLTFVVSRQDPSPLLVV